MQINTHVSFDGRCAEAFRDYNRIIAGSSITMLTYGESPMAQQVDVQWHGRIVHASLKVGAFELAGADALPHDYKKPQGFAVILNVEDVEHARRIFHELAQGGEVGLPFQATFWSAGFGAVTDRFGIPWEINSAVPPAAG